MQNHIALYNAADELIDRISDKRLERLRALGRIARVVRHRKGHINGAVQFPLPGEGRPMHATDYVGTTRAFGNISQCKTQHLKKGEPAANAGQETVGGFRQTSAGASWTYIRVV
jgi:hypothetical protein